MDKFKNKKVCRVCKSEIVFKKDAYWKPAKNGMTYPIIVNASDFRVLRGNQRVWYCIDNNIQMIGAYGIKDDDLDMYIQKTYINKKHYPL